MILLDHYDNTASGGTMDTTEVLESILKHELDDVAVFGFYDPQVVDQMQAQGVGKQITISLGGKFFMDALEKQSHPIKLTGEIKAIFNGKFKAKVAMARGLTVNMGTTAILSVGSVDIIIVSRHVEPTDPECFRSLGIEPTEKKYLMLKSRIHYRVGFRDIAKEVIECAGVGVCTSDYDQINFQSVRRPIFPLDQTIEGENEDWRNWSND
ncbi:MlrC C-terminal domain-containing protein [Gammaproteobacteria bacterium]|nr:MlrC C-terminal domain-containing protein [Gammaproteobacteria bacterium]